VFFLVGFLCYDFISISTRFGSFGAAFQTWVELDFIYCYTTPRVQRSPERNEGFKKIPTFAKKPKTNKQTKTRKVITINKP